MPGDLPHRDSYPGTGRSPQPNPTGGHDGYIHILPSEGELLMVDNGTVTRYTGTVISEALEGGLWRRWGVDGWEWLAENGDDPAYGSEPSGWLVEMLTGYQADN